MKILIAGASGYVGKAITASLISLNHQVVALSRNPERYVQRNNGIIWKRWIDNDPSEWLTDFESCDVAINLIGESIGAKRWSHERKKALLDSRVISVETFAQAFNSSENFPQIFIQTSAIGIYPSDLDEELDENAAKGDSFLAGLTSLWENSVKAIPGNKVNVSLLRLGLVISNESIIIKKFKLPFKLFVGGHLGNGRQMMSWIHLHDLVSAILYLIENKTEGGIYNFTAPNPVSMKEFCKQLGKTLRRPSWLPVPAFVLKLVFGEMANETMLSGQRVIPKKLLDNGFEFKYPIISDALF
jgi:uncharacterized protein (TIGR01777 family)